MASGETPDLVLVGRVRRPHGVRGEVAVEPLSENPDRFAPGARLLIRRADGGHQRLTVDSVRPHRNALLVRFEGLADRDLVEPLRSADLLVPSAVVGSAPEGSYYYFELIGCACRDRTEGELGEVAAIREDGGGLLLEIRGGGRELLVPFVNAYLSSIDVGAKQIELDLPEGLLETCASPS